MTRQRAWTSSACACGPASKTMVLRMTTIAATTTAMITTSLGVLPGALIAASSNR